VADYHEEKITRSETDETRDRWWRPPLISEDQATPQTHLVLACEQGKIKHQPLYDKLVALLPTIDAKLEDITKAYWVGNPILTTLFDSAIESIGWRQEINPSKFRSTDWESMPESPQKRAFMKNYESLRASSEGWNSASKIPIVAVVQGTSENSAHSIASNGFGTASSLDPGWYGSGIYFTSSMNYASLYAKDSEKDGKVFLLSLVCPGNLFPITEVPFVTDKGARKDNLNGYLGLSARPGYQAHYTMVTVDPSLRGKQGFPVTGEFLGEGVADELVVFEAAQALPVFLIYSRQKPQFVTSFSPTDNSARGAVEGGARGGEGGARGGEGGARAGESSTSKKPEIATQKSSALSLVLTRSQDDADAEQRLRFMDRGYGYQYEERLEWGR